MQATFQTKHIDDNSDLTVDPTKQKETATSSNKLAMEILQN